MTKISITMIAAALIAGCAAPPQEVRYAPAAYSRTPHPEWTKDAVLYQLNTRQFTAEGTFRAAQAHIPRLAEMGVDVIWLMPIHPIGELNRKGEMGSPYSVKDYRKINPDLGDADDLRAFVDAAHALDMRVILDWVANHSAWDNPLVTEHPDWYTRTRAGELTSPPGTDWSDTVDFDYSNPALRQYMTESLTFWVREFGIDGYRADVAGFVPLDFWETARAELEKIKPVFMLAEWETPDLHRNAFSATYAWRWKDEMHASAKTGGAQGIRGYYFDQQNTWPDDVYRMVYTSNHDQNSWDGVAKDIYGDAYEAAIVLSFIGEGLPLIYGGQEAGLSHQLSFFGKDEILWKPSPYDTMFRRLIELKTEHTALWNGPFGSRMQMIANSDEAHILSFVRKNEESRILALFNFSPSARTVTLNDAYIAGTYFDFSTDDVKKIDDGVSFDMPGWGFKVFYGPDAAN